MSYLSPVLTMLMAVVKKTSSSLNRDFSEIEKLQSSVRSHQEFVASAVKKVENNLRYELSKARPDYAFAENGKPQPNGPHFIISSLDGVCNFTHGIPHFSISIAICENGVISAAVIYNPATDELYFAEKGNGAYKEGFRNHERLRVSSRKELGECIFSTLISYKDNLAEYNAIRDKIVPEVNALRILGTASLDLAYVAAGKLDATVSLGNQLSDLAAGLLLVKEAGGSLIELNQKDIRTEDLSAILMSGNIIASNANLGKKVYDLLNK